jgi:hypothetical protein
VAAVGIVAAVGLGIGYAYQTGNNDELAEALSVANSKVSLLTSREKSLSTDLAEAKISAHSTGTEWLKARDENLALTQKLKQTQEEAKLLERRLQETVGSLTVNLAASIARANTLARALDPEKLSEIEGPKPSPQVDTAPTSSNMAVSRNNELLEKFNRTSDDFTRPKVYLHAMLGSRLFNCSNKQRNCGKCAFFNLAVNTDGKLIFEGYKLTSIQVLHEDDVISFYKIEDLLDSLKNRFSKVSNLRCRLNWDYHDFKRLNYLPFSGAEDIDLNADDIAALKDTLELANNFNK